MKMSLGQWARVVGLSWQYRVADLSCWARLAGLPHRARVVNCLDKTGWKVCLGKPERMIWRNRLKQ